MTPIDDAKNKLTGTWKLAQYIEVAKGTPDPTATGTLSYTPDGHVRARITRLRPGNAAPNEGGYDGTYALPDAQTVIHTVEASGNPDIVGLKLERNITFPDPDHLVIRGNRSGETTGLEIHWERVK